MRKTWFVGARDVGPPPAQTGDRLVPLSVVARSVMPDGGDASLPLDLEKLEAEAPGRVFKDLAGMVLHIRAQGSEERCLNHGGHDISPALRRPDEVVAGFANQELAFQIASSCSDSGPSEAWGVDPYQLAGLRAAVGDVKGGDPSPVRTSLNPPALLRGMLGRPHYPDPDPCDILYLSLEPHVAQQQDRVLGLLSNRYRIAAVALSRSSWRWPDHAGFQPRTHAPLASYLTRADLVKAGSSWMARRLSRAFHGHRVAWMPPGDGAEWLGSAWLRAAGVIDALTRAIDLHRPRLLIGTSLASGMGTVMSSCAARRGVPSLSLPTGADYLLPPYFDSADAGPTTFVVPGERIAERLRLDGFPKERLLSCGWPELDSICGIGSRDSATLRLELGLLPEQPLAVFFSTPSTASDELVVPTEVKRRGFALLARACQMEGMQLAAKLHPRESDDAIETMAAQLSPRVPIFRDRLPDLVRAADVIASVGSAVSFAGVVLGKTTVILEAGSIARSASMFASLGVGSQPRTLEALSALLRGAAAPRSHDGAGEGFLGADGKVAERILAAVEKLLG